MQNQKTKGDQSQKEDPEYSQPDQPNYRPPESQPQPRPVDPIMNKKTSSNQSTPPTQSPNTNTSA